MSWFNQRREREAAAQVKGVFESMTAAMREAIPYIEEARASFLKAREGHATEIAALQAQLAAALATRLPVDPPSRVPMTPTQAREAFEKWTAADFNLVTTGSGTYISGYTLTAWAAWQAALATRLPVDRYAARYQWLRHKHVEAYGPSAAEDLDRDLDTEMAAAKAEIASVKAGVDSAWIWS